MFKIYFVYRTYSNWLRHVEIITTSIKNCQVRLTKNAPPRPIRRQKVSRPYVVIKYSQGPSRGFRRTAPSLFSFYFRYLNLTSALRTANYTSRVFETRLIYSREKTNRFHGCFGAVDVTLKTSVDKKCCESSRLGRTNYNEKKNCRAADPE